MERGSIILPPKHHQSSDNTEQPASPLRKMVAVASIAAGIQFGWALQLSLLTPYVQTLGVPHMWASFIWLCGPLSGLLVQPLVGYYSDRCGAKFGRRTPFIVSGAVFVSVAVILIGFAAEIGVRTGDSASSLSKPRAVAIFVVGFWVLDVANNMLQGPCRALLADMSGGNHARMRTANAFFSFFMAIGNVLGYAAGSYDKLYKILHFSLKTECDAACANPKTCFIFSVCLLVLVTVMALTTVREKRYIVKKDEEEDSCIPFFSQLFVSLKTLEKPMWLLLLVTALNWIAWFPWLLYDTDWMGREIFGGDTEGTQLQKDLYERGVHYGSLGLLINSVVLALSSLALEPVSRLMRGAKNLWGLVNIILAVCLAMTAVVSHMAKEHRDGTTVPPSPIVKAAALTLFAFMGIPLSVTFSIPFALASIYCSSSGGGQGLSLGVLNLSIVIPQMIVSASSGYLDKAIGGGNLPAFIMGAIVAAISAFCAIFLLPNPPKQQQSAEDNSV